jgi:hypothetical protein
MEKIITLFKRNYESDRLVRNEVVEGAEWVLAGEGMATIKWDGTSCLIRDGKLFRRYDAKKGRVPPEGFEPSQEPDPITGHWPGWLPIGEGPEDRWHREAFAAPEAPREEGSYELLGPKVQGNAYGLEAHVLRRHGDTLAEAPRDFEGLRQWLEANEIEGIVWHHPDGRMVKLKRRDFGLKWPMKR